MNIENSASPNPANSEVEESNEPKWRPLSSIQRRVVGVLIEKSKTTKDSYPLTLNAITTACNQKSNRKPQMDLASDDVELTLDELRDVNAVVEIQGSGRTTKYKHTMYQWLDVSKVELAVMGELLLRGEQSLGDLRARAARMEPIAGLSELKPIVDSLVGKKLVVELTPSGRGQMVTHNLYASNELEQIRQQVSSGEVVSSSEPGSTSRSIESPSAGPNLQSQIDELKAEISELKERLNQLESI